MNPYLVFLRGINVGGKNVIKMAALTKVLIDIGLQNVKTLLASGNIYIESSETSIKHIQEAIKKALADHFSYREEIIIRTYREIKELIEKAPFESYKPSKDAKLYITFLSSPPLERGLSIPYETAEKDFMIIHSSEKEVLSLLFPSQKRKTTEAMKILESYYGKKITTRNYNTVLKLCQVRTP